MEDQNQILICQRNVQDLFTLQNRLEKKLELQEQKLSQMNLNLASRNEDIMNTFEKYVQHKQFRDDTTYLRQYLENKSNSFQQQFDQLQSTLHKQMNILREELTLQNQTSVEKATRLTNDALFKIESIQKAIHSDTQSQIEHLTKKSAEMEQNFINLFIQKQKLIEKLTIAQENQSAKINLFENTLQTSNKINHTPYQSGNKRLNNYQESELPLEMLKRQESALLTVTQSIRNIEKRLGSQPQIQRELSFEQFASSVQKVEQPHERIVIRSTTPKSHKSNTSKVLTPRKETTPPRKEATPPKEPSSRKQGPPSVKSQIRAKSPIELRMKTDESINSNVASPLQLECKSPTLKSNRDINKNPILKKVSPKPLVASPSSNLYEEIRMQKEYEQKMKQIKQMEESMRQSQISKQLEYDKQLQQMRNSMSQVSNESIIKNDSSIQDIRRSSSGLRSLMEKSKERDLQKEIQRDYYKDQYKPQSQQQSKYSSSSQQSNKYKSQFESLTQSTKQQLQPVQSTGKKSRTNQMKSLAQQKVQQEQSVEEVVYQLDEDGFLMDENGNYLLDEKGNYIQISDKDLEELKKQNLVIEQG